jgi:hypothetical protein
MKSNSSDWNNNSWEAPPGPYAWACMVCETHNAAGAEACEACGCPDRVAGQELFERQRQFKLGKPYDGTHRAKPKSRIPGRRLDGSNTFTFHELLESAIFVLAFVGALYQAAALGFVRVLASRHREGIEVTNPLAMGIALVGYACVLLYGVAIWADHLDRRLETEPRYKTARAWTITMGVVFVLLSAWLQLSNT